MKLRELINELELPTVKQAIDNFKFFSNPQPQVGQSATPAPTVQAQPAPVKPQQQPQVKPTTPAPVGTAKAEPAPFDPATHKPTLISLAKQHGIKNINDLSNFLSQCETETARWTSATENFNYTDPTRIHKVFTSAFPTPVEAAKYLGNPVALANRALAGKNGNGPEQTGDGWKYRGRGFIHLTGKENYAKAGAAIHPENPNIYVDRPELISSNPKESALVAIWFFKQRVGLGKTSKQATTAVAGTTKMKSKERQLAQANIKKSLAGQAAQPAKKR
ncbi:COG3179 Predicted chitinase [uncultured Caudovirales phage]|uniref:COG3179 Predicted chitinase n=1 Tax=uncultured Caudovirales phage TaxID=2100421 RepID=A0A6J7WIY5_9CAUD|nr:COG3179 Predicted chitinase [uncultured Caudovirales phage]CAB5208952.1 COG3179 Predicted chitinase [uncultured Caudovirales phage]